MGMCCVSCRSVGDHCVVFLCRSPCRHGQRLPESAVRFQSLLPLWGVILQNDAILKRLLFNCTLFWEYHLLYFVSLKKRFLDKTVFFAPNISVCISWKD